jgi:hypothetical protein
MKSKTEKEHTLTIVRLQVFAEEHQRILLSTTEPQASCNLQQSKLQYQTEILCGIFEHTEKMLSGYSNPAPEVKYNWIFMFSTNLGKIEEPTTN